MRIPHTIPKVILKAYARKLDEEELKASYEGRLLRSEDPSWDDKLNPTLSQLCLDNVIEDYVFYVKLVEEINKQKLHDHENKREQWIKDLAYYLKRKDSYDRKVLEEEIAQVKKAQFGDDPNDADDDDVRDEEDKPLRKIIIEPTKVPDEFYNFEPIKNVLDQMGDEDRIKTVEDLEFDYVPFEMAVATIPDDYYWERAAAERWPYADCDDHGKRWRRLYMEKNLWEAIEGFHPIDSDMQVLQDLLNLIGEEVIHLKLGNLIPLCYGTPLKAIEEKTPDADLKSTGQDEDAGFGEEDDLSEDIVVGYQIPKKEEEEDMETDPDENGDTEEAPTGPDRTSSSHIDFGLFLPKLVNLKVLTLVYEMAETGLDWEPRLFKFTDDDCLNLAKAIALTPSIETFELNRSHVNDEQCKVLVREGFIKMPHLKYLNLNYNRIGNAGARAIARLLTEESSRAIHTISTVRLARNKIYNMGGKALAWALTKNNHLTHLDLRLNRIGDPGGRDFAHALIKNKSLLYLGLGANRLTDNSAQVFGKMLHHNKSLKELDLSSNALEKKGGEHVALGIRGNKNILRVDVRLANIGLDFEYDVGSHLRKNRIRLGAQNSLVDRDDHYPNEKESGIIHLDDDLEDFSDPEWDDEEEEMMGGNHEEESLDFKTHKAPMNIRQSEMDVDLASITAK